MKNVYITEIAGYPDKEAEGYVLDLSETSLRDCLGCWNCWLKTPGRCVHHDLDDFYRAFIGADRAVFYIKASMGFVSGNLKTLLDRMIPHYLPYIRYTTGESMHAPRYAAYPRVEAYYTGEFISVEERQVLEDYLSRVFCQFQARSAVVRPLADEGAGGETR